MAGGIPDEPDDNLDTVPSIPQADILRSDIEGHGAVAAVRKYLESESGEDTAVELAGANRLDLTVENLVVRPAWRSLFGEPERRKAAERLIRFVALSSPAETVPTPEDDLDHLIERISDRIVRWEVDSSLPK